MKCSPGLAVSDGTASIGGDHSMTEYDIHCPLMGGCVSKKNYLLTSCKIRQGNKGCTKHGCRHRLKKSVARPSVTQQKKKVVARPPAQRQKNDSVPPPAPTKKTADFPSEPLKHEYPDSVSLVFLGDDADVMRRFMEYSTKNQGNPANDAATVLELFMDGKLEVK